MDRDIFGFMRHRPSLNLVNGFEGMIGGAMVGFASFLIKTVLIGFTFSIPSILGLVINLTTWIAVVIGGMGFLFFQKALHSRDVSIETPIMAGFGIIVPVVMAILFLGESIDLSKAIGIVIVLAGVFLLAKK